MACITPTRSAAAALVAAVALGGLGRPATADDAGSRTIDPPAMSGAARSGELQAVSDLVPPLLTKARQAAGVDEKLNTTLPLDLEFTDSAGKTVKLGDYFAGERPVIIQMAYYRCPKLCGEITKGMVKSMVGLSKDLTIGDDYEAITVSFDSRESPELAAANKAAVVDVLKQTVPQGKVEAGWANLVGDDLNIKRLTDALGYRFGWIPEAQQYSHPAVLVVATPDGRISQYVYGVTYEPQTLRLTLTNASNGTITPSVKDAFILNCFDLDPTTGKYTANAYKLMRLAGVVTVMTMGGIIGFMLLMEKRGKLKRSKYAGTPADDDDVDPDAGDAGTPPRTAFSG